MESSPKSTHALRMTFDYDGTTVRKVSQTRFENPSPPSHSPTERGVGFWYELRNADEKVLYRRVLHDPLQYDREVPSEGGGFSREPNTETHRTFHMIVPDIDGATHLVLMASPRPASARIGSRQEEAARSPEPRAPTQPAQEIARFGLQEDQP